MKMQFRFALTLMAVLVSAIVFSVSYAAVDTITTWSLSPDPAVVNGDLTTNISFSVTDPDTTHEFCIEAPANAGDSDANWYAAMPATISLNATQGLSGSELVVFNKAALITTSQANCPGGSRVAFYSGTSTLTTSSNIDYTTSTGSIIDLDAGGNVASAGTANWTLTIDSGTGAPSSVTYALELIAAPTTIYASDSPTCLGSGTAGISCFQSLSTAEDAAVAAGATTLVIVGDLTVNAAGESTTIATSITTLRGSSSGRLLASNCTTENILSVGGTAQPITIQDLTIDGAACSGAATGIRTGGIPTLNNVTILGFSSGQGIIYQGGSSSGSIADSNFENNQRRHLTPRSRWYRINRK